MSDLQETRREMIARQFIEAIPHAQELGMRVTQIADGKATIAMDYDPRLVGDPETGVIHGGAVSALMDTCAGAAVMAHPVAPVATATLALASSPAIASVAALLGGLSWIAVLTTLNVSAQTALPNWVRARGLAVNLMVFFGSMSFGH